MTVQTGGGLGDKAKERQRGGCGPVRLARSRGACPLCAARCLPLAPPGFLRCCFQAFLTPCFSLHVAGVLGSTRASLLLTGCWLWPGYCACSNKDPSPLKGQAGALGRVAGLAPRSQHRMQEREKGIFSMSVPPGRDMSSSTGSRDSVRGFSFILRPKCKGFAEGCAQRKGRSEVGGMNNVPLQQ